MALSIVFAPQLGWNRAAAWNFINLGDFNGSVPGSGVVVSQTRTVADFNSIEINFPADIIIQQGQSPSLTIEAEDNLMPQVTTNVSGSTLTIENSQADWNRRVNPTRPVTIHITVKGLQLVDFPSAGTLRVEDFEANHLDVSISGAGTVTLANLSAQSLNVNLNGAGSITASGSVGSLKMDISGLGSFQGADLASQSADISISGAGNATVWAKTAWPPRSAGRLDKLLWLPECQPGSQRPGQCEQPGQ